MNPDASLPELLAPAGSMDSLIAAVSAGADAVYLSGRTFGARYYAANFDDEELRRAVEYCHVRGVSVYVTLNTLIHDHELSVLATRLVWLYEIGVDAVLMQDIGAIALARAVVPKMPIHASTQMTLHNREGVQWACGQGMERVVLARELTGEEVNGIGKSAGCRTDLEVFVHGALCYCYSGQCLFSSLIGGRSGNRGMCAQPCRKPYRLLRGVRDTYGRPTEFREVGLDVQYLLSPHDLCVYPRLDTVVRLPIVSLKIEGRMKSPEYVATVVSIYRHALDRIREGRWHPTDEDIISLSLAFNRGFTTGYLMNQQGRALMGPDRPDNRGVCIGSVLSYDAAASRARVRLEGALIPEPGDGLVISAFPRIAKEVGFVVRHPVVLQRGSVDLTVPDSVSSGDRVYMTRRKRLSERAKAIMDPKKGAIYSPLPVDLAVRWEEGMPIIHGTVSLPGGRDIDAELRGWFRMEPARSHPLKAEQIAELLKRTGGTPFTVRSVSLSYPGGLFAPLREINTLRRAFISRLEEAIAASSRPSASDISLTHERCIKETEHLNAPVIPKPVKDRPLLAAYANTVEGVKGALEGGCERIYYETPAVCGDESDHAIFDELSALCERYGAAFVWKWPRITRRDFLDAAISVLRDMPPRCLCGVMVENVGAIRAVRSCLPDIPLYGSAGLNVFNHLTARELGKECGCVTVSQELSRGQIRLLSQRLEPIAERPALEYIVHGSAEMMVSENCLLSTVLGDGSYKDSEDVWWGIEDSKGHIFPLVIDTGGRTHIYNAVETCLIDHLPDLRGAGIDVFAIDTRNRTATYAREVTALYRTALELVSGNDPKLEGKLKRMKEQLKGYSLGGITTGHFIKGLYEE